MLNMKDEEITRQTEQIRNLQEELRALNQLKALEINEIS